MAGKNYRAHVRKDQDDFIKQCAIEAGLLLDYQSSHIKWALHQFCIDRGFTTTQKVISAAEQSILDVIKGGAK